MKILENLLQDIKLNPAVINVLVDYVLSTNNNKLSKSYVETIAGQWKRSGIETASEAMDMAKKEHNKAKKTTDNNRKKVLPSWIDEKITSEQGSIEEEEEFKNFIEEFRK